MYNSDTPLRAELPSSKKLLRSTLLAAISALVLLFAVVLPAEYGVDPTGLGRVLRMTDMGDVGCTDSPTRHGGDQCGARTGSTHRTQS
jgi:hypothetical protein